MIQISFGGFVSLISLAAREQLGAKLTSISRTRLRFHSGDILATLCPLRARITAVACQEAPSRESIQDLAESPREQE